MCSLCKKRLTTRHVSRIVRFRCTESAAEGENSIRVTSKFYYRFAFIYRFSFTEERAGETRADHARNRS
jgi:hypothetical protein